MLIIDALCRPPVSYLPSYQASIELFLSSTKVLISPRQYRRLSLLRIHFVGSEELTNIGIENRLWKILSNWSGPLPTRAYALVAMRRHECDQPAEDGGPHR